MGETGRGRDRERKGERKTGRRGGVGPRGSGGEEERGRRGKWRREKESGEGRACYTSTVSSTFWTEKGLLTKLEIQNALDCLGVKIYYLRSKTSGVVSVPT